MFTSFFCGCFIYKYMSLIDEIEKFMISNDASMNYRTINLGGKSLYLEGLKSITKLDDNEMQFQLKKCAILVSGSNLKIKYLDKTTCVILGEIKAVIEK